MYKRLIRVGGQFCSRLGRGKNDTTIETSQALQTTLTSPKLNNDNEKTLTIFFNNLIRIKKKIVNPPSNSNKNDNVLNDMLLEIENIENFYKEKNIKKCTKHFINLLDLIFSNYPKGYKLYLRDMFVSSERFTNDSILSDNIFEKQFFYMTKYYIYIFFLFNKIKPIINIDIKSWCYKNSFFALFFKDTNNRFFLGDEVNKNLIQKYESIMKIIQYPFVSYKELILYLPCSTPNESTRAIYFSLFQNTKSIAYLSLEKLKETLFRFLEKEQKIKDKPVSIFRSSDKKNDTNSNENKKIVDSITKIVGITISQSSKYSAILCETKGPTKKLKGTPIIIFFAGIFGGGYSENNDSEILRNTLMIKEIGFVDDTLSKFNDLDIKTLGINESTKSITIQNTNGNTIVIGYTPLVQNIPNTNIHNTLSLYQKKSDNETENEHYQECLDRLRSFNELYFDTAIKRSDIIRIGDGIKQENIAKKINPNGQYIAFSYLDADFHREKKEDDESNINTPIVTEIDVIKRLKDSKQNLGDLTGCDIFQTIKVLDLEKSRLIIEENENKTKNTVEKLHFNKSIKIKGRSIVSMDFSSNGNILGVCIENLDKSYSIYFIDILSNSILKGKNDIPDGIVPIRLQFLPKDNQFMILGKSKDKNNSKLHKELFFFSQKKGLEPIDQNIDPIKKYGLQFVKSIKNGNLDLYISRTGEHFIHTKLNGKYLKVKESFELINPNGSPITNDCLKSITFSKDGNFVFFGGKDGKLYILNIETQELKFIQLHNEILSINITYQNKSAFVLLDNNEIVGINIPCID